MDNQRLKDLILKLQLFVTEKKVDDEIYFKLAEHFCREYADLYIKPIMEGTGEPVAELKFTRQGSGTFGKGVEDVAFYDPPSKSVNINLGYVVAGEDNSEKFLRLLTVIKTVGHEYEHSFQHRYTYYYLLFKDHYANPRQYQLKDKNITNHELYKKIIGERADEIAEDFITEQYKKDEVKTMLKFFKGLEKDIYSQFTPEEQDDEDFAADICLYALYFKRAAEEDARKKERQIFGKFAEDVKNIDGINPLFPVFIDKVAEMAESEEELQQMQDTPVYKKIKGLMDNLSANDYVAFGKLLENENLIGLKNMRFFADQETAYADFFVKQKILLDAFNFILHTNKFDGGKKVWGNLEQLNKVRLAFMKHGLSSSTALAEQTNGAKIMPRELNTRFRDGYYLMLRDEPITLYSFDKIDLLKPAQRLEILTKMIETGRYEFANSMIQSMGDEIKTYLRTDNLDVEAELKKIREEGDFVKEWYFLDEVEPMAKFNIMGSIEKRVNLLDKQQKEGKLCFDDVDEMISLLATLCESVNVPYYKENALLPQNTPNAKVANKLYDLYQKMEDVGRKEACKISGYELNPDAYRYAHRQDRDYYLLQGRDKEKRIERLYGKNELARFQRENNIEKLYEDDCEVEHE